MATRKWCSKDVKAAIASAASSLGYSKLKKEQEEALLKFVGDKDSGQDAFVVLPTGHGKSLCYACIPATFDTLCGVEKRSIVVVVTPLIALMKDQVAIFTSKGVSATYVGCESEMEQAIMQGSYQLIFISPESLLGSRRWCQNLQKEPFVSNLVAFVVEEAHCVKKW
jgi:superfamily II DNA helicase RecQ